MHALHICLCMFEIFPKAVAVSCVYVIKGLVHSVSLETQLSSERWNISLLLCSILIPPLHCCQNTQVVMSAESSPKSALIWLWRWNKTVSYEFKAAKLYIFCFSWSHLFSFLSCNPLLSRSPLFISFLCFSDALHSSVLIILQFWTSYWGFAEKILKFSSVYM